ncbi:MULTISPECIES: AMP-binding protein [unclassified Micromonospora]|uniref:AMP-binding protein n=1 Tax=unclassified Micromonospora TaxID=2617518 RepID=UPI001C227CE9|nr:MULTISPECIES: AMP-binding protein [unclassified Micromonospora]MBU8860432.1 AMP-binding protein [Micromonospora sp. WMMB482]MDM4779969.1 AMP-binding protein [Micromonospora sp. b486]
MAQLLHPMVAAAPDAVALDDGYAALSWRNLDQRVNRWCDLLHREGLRPGDRVGVLAGNRHEVFELLLACLHAGLVIVPMNWHLTGAEVAYLLSDSGCRALVTDTERLPAARDAWQRNDRRPGLRVVLGDEPVDGFAAAEPLLAQADAAEPPEAGSGATGLYTSGTTGAPKAVVSRLFRQGEPLPRLSGRLNRLCTVLGMPADGVNLLCGPWYHSGQLFFSLLPLIRGFRLVTRPRFDPAATLRLIDDEGVTMTHLVPTQFVRLLRLDPAVRAAFGGATLRRVWHGAAPCPVDVKRQMIAWWGPVLSEYYAATEAGIATIIHADDWLAHPGSVGRPLPRTEIVVVGTDDMPLPAGHEGRVYLRRPDGFEYRDAPEKTRAAHRADGSFTYGDRGYLDAAGYLYLTGRADDMILSGGVNVYPAEVEAVLLRHPAVRDAVVFGVPDEEFGQQVRAVVEVDTHALTDDLTTALDRHCRRELAGFKVPRSYELSTALPREDSGKVRRQALHRSSAHRSQIPDSWR